MMQPIDIKSQSFGTGLFGYKKNDVDQYVDTVYRAYDELFTENKNLREEKERLNKVIEESNLKIFELEGQLNSKGSSASSTETKNDDKSDFASTINVDDLDDFELDDATKPEEKKEEKSAASKFFHDSEDTVLGGDDDDVFVGEIEDNRKSNKAMIGDGEEEGADDFEFL